MKKGIFLIILLLLVPLALAKSESVTLYKGKSEIIENNNLTLLDFDKEDEKMVVCVNNQKGIVSDDRKIGEVHIDIRSFESEGVRVILDSDCDDCNVGDNLDCYDECNLDKDCGDGDEETVDYCKGRPKRCTFEKILIKDVVPKPVEGENGTKEENKTEGNSSLLTQQEEFGEVEYFSFFKKLVFWILGLGR